MKCFCKKDPAFCSDCNSKSYPLDEQEIEDVLSALSFFCKKYPDRYGSRNARKDMDRLSKKLFKMKVKK